MDEMPIRRNITTDEMRDNLIFVLTVYIPLDLVIIVGNALVLFVIRQTSRSFEEPQFVLLGSLAFVDLLTGIIAVPMFMWACISRRSLYLQNNCHLQYIPTKVFIAVSWFHLLLITMDRYVSIIKPLHYYKHITLHRIYFSIALSWIMGIFYGTMEVFWKVDKIEGIFFCYQISRRAIEVQRYVTLVLVAIGTILLMILYFRIVVEARKHEKNIICIPVSTRKIVRKRSKAAKTSALVICAFGITFFPHALQPVVYLLVHQQSDMYWYVLIAELLVNLSSAVNPFIYVWRLQPFSRALRRLVNKSPITATLSTTETCL
ncbi:trace amine-associated receptor 9-like [Antedon mediterranea]|uniref:trace amine-associated receptor 9-like n=1 Tax=Antedon mediterranea TaxID=105859 RepID=UPI003AF91E86